MTGKMSLYYKAHFLNPSPNRIWVIALCLSVFVSSGTQQSDTKRQHLLERLLDAVKQVRFLLCPCICMFKVEGHKMTFGCLLKPQYEEICIHFIYNLYPWISTLKDYHCLQKKETSSYISPKREMYLPPGQYGFWMPFSSFIHCVPKTHWRK